MNHKKELLRSLWVSPRRAWRLKVCSERKRVYKWVSWRFAITVFLNPQGLLQGLSYLEQKLTRRLHAEE